MGYRDLLLKLLEADVGLSDITSTAIVPKHLRIRARVIADADGVVAGIEDAIFLLNQFDLKVSAKMNDGNEVRKGETILEMEGNARRVFECERTVLNIIGRMSGIATMTAEAVRRARKQNGKVRIAATRKTALPFLDKKAVKYGGGDTHRLQLSNAILIKTNHLRIIGRIDEALRLARKNTSFMNMIEIEVRNAEEALEAAKNGADVLMFDNMPHDEIDRSIKMLKDNGLRDRVIIELSGGITIDNVEEYAKHDCDVISMGCLTHSVKWLPVSLRVTSG